MDISLQTQEIVQRIGNGGADSEEPQFSKYTKAIVSKVVAPASRCKSKYVRSKSLKSASSKYV